MSLIDVRQAFSYLITTQSLNYIRNYNFDSATVSNIPVILSNSDPTISLTVNMTPNYPWMYITEPGSNTDLRYPSGNVVLPPSSSKTVLLKIDLPREIEDITNEVVQINPAPRIQFDILSGSLKIVSTDSDTRRNIIVTNPAGTIIIERGEVQTVEFTVFDETSQPIIPTPVDVEWKVYDESIATVQEAGRDLLLDNLSNKKIIGLSSGSTTIDITYKELKTQLNVSVYNVYGGGGNDSSTSAPIDNQNL